MRHLLFTIIFAVTAQAFGAEYGSVMLLTNGKTSLTKVELHPTTGGELKNEFVSFVDAPVLEKDESGCFCYPETDIRFAYVHAYYHATKQLMFFQDKVNKLVPGPKETIQIKLIQSPDDGTWGMVTEKNHIQLEFQKPAFDQTSLAHEIGHIIHGQLGASELIEVELVFDYAISEGTGNMLAALYQGSSVIGEIGPFPLDINTLVESNNLYTFRRFYEEALQNLIGKNLFPDSIVKMKDVFNQSEATDFLDSLNPYKNSNIINQPLWLAAQKFHKDEIIEIYLKAISNTTAVTSFSDFAQRLLDASPCQEITGFLLNQFVQRGLQVKRP